MFLLMNGTLSDEDHSESIKYVGARACSRARILVSSKPYFESILHTTLHSVQALIS